MGKTGLGFVDGVEHCFEVVYKQRCSSGGRLDSGMGDHIEDAFITVMADASDDGQGEVGDVLSQGEGVETTHVARGTTTSYNYDAVKYLTRGLTLCEVEDAVEGIDDTLLYTFALHDGREELGTEFETIGIISELVAEVTIACS